MTILIRIAIVVFCFFAAIACYVFGVPAGGAGLIILGVLFEGLFWIGIFGRKKTKSTPKKPL